MSDWISVEDKLPNSHTDVLLTIELKDGTRTVHIGYYYTVGKQWRTYGCFDMGDRVVAWMPRPEPAARPQQQGLF